MASTAAITTGKYAGRQPAMTALMAIFSMVAMPCAGGISPTSSWAARPAAATIAATRSSVGGTTASPSVQPRAKNSSTAA